MSRGPQTFKQRDLTKALKGAVAAGIGVKRVEIDRSGKIIIVPGQPHPEEAVPGNEWDTVK